MPDAFLIDTDTASDDAVALIMALRSESARVIAITTVAGNVPVEQATRNALYTAELCGASAPVYQGAEKPLARALVTAEWFHGADGFGDHGYPPPQRRPGSSTRWKRSSPRSEQSRAHAGDPRPTHQHCASLWLRHPIWFTTSAAA